MILQARKWYRSMKVFRRANYRNDKWTPGTLMNIIEGEVVKGMVFPLLCREAGLCYSTDCLLKIQEFGQPGHDFIYLDRNFGRPGSCRNSVNTFNLFISCS